MSGPMIAMDRHDITVTSTTSKVMDSYRAMDTYYSGGQLTHRATVHAQSLDCTGRPYPNNGAFGRVPPIHLTQHPGSNSAQQLLHAGHCFAERRGSPFGCWQGAVDVAAGCSELRQQPCAIIQTMVYLLQLLSFLS